MEGKEDDAGIFFREGGRKDLIQHAPLLHGSFSSGRGRRGGGKGRRKIFHHSDHCLREIKKKVDF